jgi:hypothetical protein
MNDTGSRDGMPDDPAPLPPPAPAEVIIEYDKVQEYNITMCLL